MWIIRVALRRPYTFIVLALLIFLFGSLAILRTAVDIFPNIRIPVVAAVWTYTGLPPDEIANRIVLFSERTAQTVVNDVEHTESQSLNGMAVVKYFFQPNVNEDLAYAQITGISQTGLKFTPPGTTPPFILAYDASTVPIIQLALSSTDMSESEVSDIGNSVIRTALSAVSGASLPFPYGGRQRQMQVDLDPGALRAHGLSAQDVTSAISAQNLILPAGTQKIGSLEYFVKLNASPDLITDLNDFPIRTQNGSVVYVRDVAQVRDGSPPQTNVVRVDGHRAALMSVLKTGGASTLQIIDEIKRRLPALRSSVPAKMKIETIGDQSLFVRAAVEGVIREGVIAASLTGLMILLFLGSWRSTLIISLSIPLSILSSLIFLSALGETINIMTLGGLALAVGILVDDATVTIENINWHLEQGSSVEDAILLGAQEIALPALVSTLAICIVFVPMFFLTGIARFLFVPLAEAVVFAMIASYLLSRTLVPTLANYWLRTHQTHVSPNLLSSVQKSFERRFEALREIYSKTLMRVLDSGPRFALTFSAVIVLSAFLAFPLGPLPGLGQDFFPAVDAGQIKIHLRARTGSRIEETIAICDQIEAMIKQDIPAAERASVVDNIGLPYSSINTAYSNSAPIGPGDADIFISLRPGHRPTDEYIEKLRPRLSREFPAVTFAFLPADIVSQILNFGIPAPINIQITGFNTTANRALASTILAQLGSVPGLTDIRMQQAFDYPQINVTVNRTNAILAGLTETNIANNLLVSLSGSFQTSPNFWIDPKSGTQYAISTQTPQYRMTTLDQLASTPITGGNSTSQLLSNIATLGRSAGPANVTHYNAVPTLDIYASVHGIDLGYAAAAVGKIVASAKQSAARGSNVVLRGQVVTMNSSFEGLLFGLAGAIVLVYLLIVINFQSWLDSIIIITALPAALAGIVWMLFLTRTTVSVPALTGIIMCMGVATANSILVVSFARTQMNGGLNATAAAYAAGFMRFRPVLMTALAMIIGMVPMALGMGEGGEQNAPLGRAVIGGLSFATISTLLFVPVVFALVHRRRAESSLRSVKAPESP